MLSDCYLDDEFEQNERNASEIKLRRPEEVGRPESCKRTLILVHIGFPTRPPILSVRSKKYVTIDFSYVLL